MPENIQKRTPFNIKFIVFFSILAACFIILLLSLDQRVILWMKAFNNGSSPVHAFLQYINPFMNIVSNGATLVLSSLVLWVFGRFYSARLNEIGRSLTFGFLISGICVQVLKRLSGRARPKLTDGTLFTGFSMRDMYHSFPSGHTAVAFCFAYILSRSFPRYRSIFFLFASLVGFERIENLKHFPSDVLAGAVIGVLAAKLMCLSLNSNKVDTGLNSLGRSRV